MHVSKGTKAQRCSVCLKNLGGLPYIRHVSGFGRFTQYLNVCEECIDKIVKELKDAR